MRWALGISYDGSAFNGWQCQPEPARTVQLVLEHALGRFLGTEAHTVCAGRTDSGVHALGQVVHIDTTIERQAISWVRGVNAHLPSDVRVLWARQVSDDFSARFSALHRTYSYVLANSMVRSPIWRQQTGWVFRPLDIDRMRQALPSLIGTHDFSAFRAAQCQARNPQRTMHQASIEVGGDFLVLTLQANAFLQHMVRNIVGALVDIGVGRQEPSWIAELLLQKDRRLASPTFSPAGLYLRSVHYDPAHGLSPVMQESRTLFPFLPVQSV